MTLLIPCLKLPPMGLAGKVIPHPLGEKQTCGPCLGLFRWYKHAHAVMERMNFSYSSKTKCEASMIFGTLMSSTRQKIF